jgi:hypothetical protein
MELPSRKRNLRSFLECDRLNEFMLPTDGTITAGITDPLMCLLRETMLLNRKQLGGNSHSEDYSGFSAYAILTDLTSTTL